ncbi:MAG: 3-methyl-2-oxobutanoate hydroxymethyltransferase [Rhodospirillales bacterium]|nr:3-methyl-2-oxobutanoate hydroxymethyltransferase [Alphaproteobacteria bacterium]MCB1840845.1 3-methyl-2-oxobutanoate hydroxymethyltransferase [Alphaproteobacteria bacterium]MCB9977750.1 3-methyl-2-oxobutanoate hydroxymethyltransferase [Rhodospirillales bacterium]
MPEQILPDRLTIASIRAWKNARAPLVCLTAYTAPMAQILDPHCDILLVGDSIGMALYGMDNTLGVTLETMIAHGRAVMSKARTACVLIDMPYGTYEDTPQQAYESARRLLIETGCDGVKLEGGHEMAETIRYLAAKDIPVMAHIGLKPQSVVKEGGYKIKGKTGEEAEALMEDAKAVEAAGAFALLIEGTVEPVARAITQSVDIPTIGIGASPACDGQILVTEDMLGLITDHTPKFVKKYVNLAEEITKAVETYAADVRSRAFPDESHTYGSAKKAKAQ